MHGTPDIPTPAPAAGTSPLARADAAAAMRRATMASVAVALTLVVAKTAAWWLTDSVALLSTLVDSMLDAAASLLTFFAVRHSVQPADAEHRFGHGKAEALASLGQAAFVAGSGVLLLFEAIRRLIAPKPIGHEFAGIGVMVFSIALTFALIVYQRRIVRRTGSLAISGDRLHYEGDLLTNGSVIVALLGHMLFAWESIDSVFAILIVGYLMWNAWQIARAALDELMDRELSDADRARILAIARQHPAARSVHDLRTRRAGLHTFIQLHLELDPEISLAKAHMISDEIEAELLRSFPNAEIIIHQDPEGYDTAPPLAGGHAA